MNIKFYDSYEYATYKAKQTVPKMRYDGRSDVREWQKKSREKLADLLGMDCFEKCDDLFTITEQKECDGYTQIDFEFQSEEGYFVPCNLLIPKGASEKRPGVICLQGHSTGKHISIGVAKFPNDAETIAGGRDFAIRTVREGCCAIAMDQRYMGEAGQNENGAPACSTLGIERSTQLLGRTIIGERVWDIMRLIDVIYANLTEYIDTEKIICMGNSGGGTATFYASCLEERICFSMPSCAVSTFEASIIATKHCICNYIPGIGRYFDMGDLGGLIAPRPLVMVCGKDDLIFPIDGAKECFELTRDVYKQYGKEDLCHMVIGPKGHQFYPDEAWPVMHGLLR